MNDLNQRVLSYDGLVYFYNQLATKFADTQTVDDISDDVNSLKTYFSTNNGSTLFSGIAEYANKIYLTNYKDSNTTLYLTGTTSSSLSNASILGSFIGNASITQSGVSSAASSQGTTTLTLGNSSATGSTHDSMGQIRLYSPSSTSVYVSYNNTSTTSYLTLPAGGAFGAPAELALKGEVTTVANNLTTTNTNLSKLSTDLTTLTKDHADDISGINNILNGIPSTYVTKTQLNNEISALLGGATEEELRTLKALSDALNDDANFATTINAEIANRVLTTTYNEKMTALDDSIADLQDNKVDNTTFVTSNVDGIVPKADTADGIISSSITDWVLTSKNGTIGWYKLPTNVFNSTTYSVATYNTLGLVQPAYTSTAEAILTTAAASNSTTIEVATRSTTAGRYYGVEADVNGVLFVNVPWINSDTKVKQTATTTNGEFPLILRGTSESVDTTIGYTSFASAITANPSTGTITAANFVGDGSGLTALSAANISAGTLPVGRGGTGATTAKAALTNLGIYYGTDAPDPPQEGMIWLQP